MSRLSKETEAEIRDKMGKDCYTSEVLAELTALRAELAAAEKQRDALLEAAKEAVASPFGMAIGTHERLSAAIAAAERKPL